VDEEPYSCTETIPDDAIAPVSARNSPYFGGAIVWQPYATLTFADVALFTVVHELGQSSMRVGAFGLS